MKFELDKEQIKELKSKGYSGDFTLSGLFEDLQFDIWNIDNVSKTVWEVSAEAKFRENELIDALFDFAIHKYTYRRN